MLPTTFAKATAVKIWKCCQYQYQLSMKGNQPNDRDLPQMRTRARAQLDTDRKGLLSLRILWRRRRYASRAPRIAGCEKHSRVDALGPCR